MTNIPTVAEQVELATRAHAAIGGSVQIDGRWYRVVRFHYEIRFFGERKHSNDIPPSAHIDCLRADRVKAATLPGGYQYPELKAQCERIVAAALAA